MQSKVLIEVFKVACCITCQKILQTPSVIAPAFPQTIDHIVRRLYFARLDLTVAESQDLQKGHGFLGLLIAGDVLQASMTICGGLPGST